MNNTSGANWLQQATTEATKTMLRLSPIVRVEYGAIKRKPVPPPHIGANKTLSMYFTIDGNVIIENTGE
jgi:hypothetical protein